MKPFKILSREIILDNPYCPIEKHIVELPDGTQGEWFVNTASDAVIVIPVLKTGEILLQKNYKHGSGHIITEFCAGMIDPGETPEQAATRELLEETGHSAESFTRLGEAFANPTGSSMKYHFFLAQNCEKVSDQSLDTAEQIEIFTVKNAEEAKKLLTDPATHTSSATLSALTFL